MKGKWFLVLCILLWALPFGIIHAQNDLPSDIRLFHAASNWDRHDFYLNGQYAATLSYGEAADYVLLEPGEAILQVVDPGEPLDGDLTFEGTFTVGSDQMLNIAVIGPDGNVRLGVYEIDGSPLALNQSRVHLIDAVSGGPTVSVSATTLAGETFPLANALIMAEDATSVVPTGVHRLNSEGILTDTPVAFNARMAFTAYVVGASDGSHRMQVLTFSSQTTLNGAAGFARFVHALPASPALDLYLNGTLVVPSLQYTGKTLYLVLEPGSYEVAYYHAGRTGQPIMTENIEVADGSSQTVVAMPNNGEASVEVFSDDRSIVPDEQSRITIINTLSVPIDLIVDGNPAVSGLGWGQLSEGVVLQGGPHALSFMAGASELEVLEAFEVLPIAASKLRTFVVTADGIIPLPSRALPA